MILVSFGGEIVGMMHAGYSFVPEQGDTSNKIENDMRDVFKIAAVYCYDSRGDNANTRRNATVDEVLDYAVRMEDNATSAAVCFNFYNHYMQTSEMYGDYLEQKGTQPDMSVFDKSKMPDGFLAPSSGGADKILGRYYELTEQGVSLDEMLHTNVRGYIS